MLPRHLPVLDGLRAIAVLMVLWNHVPRTLPGYPEWLVYAEILIGPGGFGVELFFVLSGFLITRILIAEREQGVPVRWFLLRRCLRIFPIYYLLLAVMLVVRPSADIAWCAVYLSNFKSLFAPVDGPLAHTWSLCVEEHFYLLWPLAVAFLPARMAPLLLGCVVVPLAIGGAWLVSELVPTEQANVVVQHAEPFRFLTLGTGALLAFHEARLRTMPRHALGLGLALVAVAVVLHPYVLFFRPALQQEAPWVDPRYGPLLWLVQSGSLCTGLVLLALLLGQRFPANPLAWRPLRAIGRISYGLYLYHLPLYYWLLLPAPSGTAVLTAVGASFAVATASWFVVERPLLRVAARFRARENPAGG
ncbi:MAG: acyltransferase [Planctomycetes bacterium]|nr:acyltransferase [Planctomycetota bacterium]